MDSLTHVALGACMGEAFAGKKLGKKAMLWGALAQSIPDIDFLATFWMDTSSILLAHRGFTHSFLFCALSTPILAALAEKWHKSHSITFKRWALFFGAVIFTHIFIDAFNNYGVGWFEPCHHQRIALNSIYVADPFFSIWPALACLVMLLFRKKKIIRKRAWQWGLGGSALYLIYSLYNKTIVANNFIEELHRQEIEYDRYFTTPAPLQNWLWFLVAGDEGGFHVGYQSTFDENKEIKFEYFPRNDFLLDSLTNRKELDQLIRFSQGFYTIEAWGDTLVFNDLRFGQMLGWKDPRNSFVFHYYLKEGSDNSLVVQRGRFAEWDLHAIRELVRQSRGKK